MFTYAYMYAHTKPNIAIRAASHASLHTLHNVCIT